MNDDDLSRNLEDPTRSTIAMLLREISNLEQKLTIRIDASDARQTKFEDNITRIPTEVDKAVGSLKELHNQRFDSVDHRFVERDSRREAEKSAADQALKAALQAQKDLSMAQDGCNAEALRKAQEGTDKQVGNLKAFMETNISSLNDKISAMGSRLDRGEGSLGGAHARTTDTRLNMGLAVALVVAAVAVVGLVLKGMT